MKTVGMNILHYIEENFETLFKLYTNDYVWVLSWKSNP